MSIVCRNHQPARPALCCTCGAKATRREVTQTPILDRDRVQVTWSEESVYYCEQHRGTP